MRLITSDDNEINTEDLTEEQKENYHACIVPTEHFSHDEYDLENDLKALHRQRYFNIKVYSTDALYALRVGETTEDVPRYFMVIPWEKLKKVQVTAQGTKISTRSLKIPLEFEVAGLMNARPIMYWLEQDIRSLALGQCDSNDACFKVLYRLGVDLAKVSCDHHKVLREAKQAFYHIIFEAIRKQPGTNNYISKLIKDHLHDTPYFKLNHMVKQLVSFQKTSNQDRSSFLIVEAVSRFYAEIARYLQAGTIQTLLTYFLSTLVLDVYDKLQPILELNKSNVYLQLKNTTSLTKKNVMYWYNVIHGLLHGDITTENGNTTLSVTFSEGCITQRKQEIMQCLADSDPSQSREKLMGIFRRIKGVPIFDALYVFHVLQLSVLLNASNHSPKQLMQQKHSYQENTRTISYITLFLELGIENYFRRVALASIFSTGILFYLQCRRASFSPLFHLIGHVQLVFFSSILDILMCALQREVSSFCDGAAVRPKGFFEKHGPTIALGNLALGFKDLFLDLLPFVLGNDSFLEQDGRHQILAAVMIIAFLSVKTLRKRENKIYSTAGIQSITDKMIEAAVENQHEYTVE